MKRLSSKQRDIVYQCFPPSYEYESIRNPDYRSMKSLCESGLADFIPPKQAGGHRMKLIEKGLTAREKLVNPVILNMNF